MSHDLTPYSLKATLNNYLMGLQESGLDGIPVELAGGGVSAVIPMTAEKLLKASSAEPEVKSINLPESLEQIKKELGNCQRCQLGKAANKPVFGSGNPKARLVFVGEWSEADDEKLGEPFAGASGQVLNRIITAMGLKREDVYLCNIVKCCPPGNREPLPDEVATCAPFLLRQIRSINPGVVVALGRLSTLTLLGLKEPISKLRGKFHNYNGIPVMPTYHPSHLEKNKGDSGLFWEVWGDMVQVLQLLNLPVPEKGRKR